MKYYGTIGFVSSVETTPDVYDYQVVEKPAYGEILKYSRRSQSSDKQVDDISISQQVSIIADPFIFDNVGSIKYISWIGTNWTVTDVLVEPPKLTLTLGGVYNGPTA